MVKYPIRWLCLVVGLAGCAAGDGLGAGAAGSPAADPFAGRYPVIAWQSWTFDVPIGMEVAPDGSVRPAAARANGHALVAAEAIPGVLAAMRANPEVRLLAQKVGFSEPGGLVFLGADEGGVHAAARLLRVQGQLTADGLVCEVDLYDVRTGGMAGGGSGQQLVPAGHAQVWLWHGEDLAQPATWCMVLPKVLRRLEDLQSL